LFPFSLSWVEEYEINLGEIGAAIGQPGKKRVPFGIL